MADVLAIPRRGPAPDRAPASLLYLHTQPPLFNLLLGMGLQASPSNFAGMEPPTQLNTTVWMLLLSDTQRERIVDRLANTPQPLCALRRQRRVFTGPLARHVEGRFVTLFRVEVFGFRVRREPGRPARA